MWAIIYVYVTDTHAQIDTEIAGGGWSYVGRYGWHTTVGYTLAYVGPMLAHL